MLSEKRLKVIINIYLHDNTESSLGQLKKRKVVGAMLCKSCKMKNALAYSQQAPLLT
jgi:hypothetical protein